jgi:hypothetical protein
MVGQVKIVAILMLVQGGLAALAALFRIIQGLIFMISPSVPPSGPGGPEVSPALVGGIGGGGVMCIGFLALIAGALDIFGGLKALKFQNRNLVLAALFANLLAFCGCFCITPLGLMIYGLIVMFNAQVIEAFQLGDQGTPPDQIVARFQAPPPPPPPA